KLPAFFHFLRRHCGDHTINATKSRKMNRTRLDSALVARGLCPSREKAKALIIAGAVFSGTQRMDSPSELVTDLKPLELRLKKDDFVSRAGNKLDHALKTFGISVE